MVDPKRGDHVVSVNSPQIAEVLVSDVLSSMLMVG